MDAPVEGPVTEAPTWEWGLVLGDGPSNHSFGWFSSVRVVGKTVQPEPPRAQSPGLWECARITFVLAPQGQAPEGVPNVCAQRGVSNSTADRRRQMLLPLSVVCEIRVLLLWTLSPQVIFSDATIPLP